MGEITLEEFHGYKLRIEALIQNVNKINLIEQGITDGANP